MDSGPSRLEAALLDVFREQRPRLWGFLTRSSRGTSAAEDLLQETFLRAWDHRQALAKEGGGDDREGVRRYLWRVARNLVIDEFRSDYRRRGERGTEGVLPLDGEKAVPDSNPSPAERLEREDCLRAVRETAGRIPNVQARRCLELWLEGEDLPGIAVALGLGTGQVRGLLQRAKAEVVLRVTDRLKAAPAAPRQGD